eukprot:336217-Pleurochrysis_carterae.AAC.1
MSVAFAVTQSSLLYRTAVVYEAATEFLPEVSWPPRRRRSPPPRDVIPTSLRGWGEVKLRK